MHASRSHTTLPFSPVGSVRLLVAGVLMAAAASTLEAQSRVSGSAGAPAAGGALPRQLPGGVRGSLNQATDAAAPARHPDLPVGLSAGPDVFGGYASTHVMARLVDGVVAERAASGALLLRDRDGIPSPAAIAVLSRHGVTAIGPALRRAPAQVELARALGLDRFVKLELAPGHDAPALVAELRTLGGLVEIAELDGIGGVAGVPNDPNFGVQYAMHNTGQVIQGMVGVANADVNGPEAWETTTGDGSLLIVLLDSGLNEHSEIAGRIVPGWNVPQDNGNTVDGCNSHGTHVAGIAGATGNNGVGIAGMCWNVDFMPIVVVNPCGGPESYVAAGLTLAADAGADIINMSLQYNGGSTLLFNSVQYAAATGAVLVAATGNFNTAVAYPAKWDQTIAVAATNNQDKRWSSSNFGPEVDVAAGGHNVYSLSGTASYTYKTGTSMAVPVVSGLAALLWTVAPDLTAAEIRTAIEDSAKDVETAGFDPLTGHGRVDAAAALLLVSPPPLPGDLDANGIVDGQDLGLLLAAWGICIDCGDGVPCPADLDGSCTVDGADLGLLLSLWS